MRLFRRLVYWLGHRARAAELDEELAVHRELVEKDFRERGLSPTEAAAAARRALGNETYMREESRAVWIWPWFGALLQDLHYGVRGFRRSPGFLIVAVTTLALGVGANIAMFGIVDALLFRSPEGVGDAQHVVRVRAEIPGRGGTGVTEFSDLLSYPDFASLRDSEGAFSGVAAFLRATMVVGDGDVARNEQAILATGKYFSVLSAPASLGRVLEPSDDRTMAALPVVVLSWDFWQRAYGGDRGVLGRLLRVGGRPFTVVGVAGRHFVGTDLGAPAVWLPLGAAWNLGYDAGLTTMPYATWLLVVARLEAGSSRERAREIAGSALSLARAQAGGAAPGGKGTPSSGAMLQLRRLSGAGVGLSVPDRGTDDAPQVSLWFLAVTGIVLLIACANVANLLLARASKRGHELSVRASIGATRSRLVRQLLTESVLLATLGSLAGLALALASTALLPRVITLPPLPPLLDKRLLWFTVSLTLATTVVAGIVPALRASLLANLNPGTRGGSTRSSLRNVLVVMQLAASVVLLVCAGLFLRSLSNVKAIDPGFEVERLLQVSGDTRGVAQTRVQSDEFWRNALQKVRRLPGVRSVALGGFLPFEAAYQMPVSVPGAGGGPIPAQPDFAGADYFVALGIRIQEGRPFTENDQRPDAPPVVIINQALSRALFEGASPIGRCIRAGPVGPDGACAEVVGVAADAKYGDVTHDPKAMFYRPMGARPEGGGYGSVLHIRTIGDPALLTGAVRREVLSLDPSLLLLRVQPLQELLAPQFVPWQTGTFIFSLFGMLGLLLASVGLYGVISLLVAQRAHELGVRLALGATSRDVVGLVVGQGARQLLVGLVVGMLGAAAASRVFAAMMFGVSRADPVAYLGATVVLTSVALGAVYLPARRATRVDPVVTLRAT